MLHPPYAHPWMHAINSSHSYQIPHTPHAKQNKTTKCSSYPIKGYTYTLGLYTHVIKPQYWTLQHPVQTNSINSIVEITIDLKNQTQCTLTPKMTTCQRNLHSPHGTHITT